MSVIFQELIFQGYSHPGLEKVYSKADIDDKDAIRTDGDSLRQVKDFKVRSQRSLRDIQLILTRKATRLAAKRTQRSRIFGSRKTPCQDSVLS